MTSKLKKDKIKQGNRRDFDLLYDVLVSGGTYSDYRSELLDRSMPQEQLNFDISEDDILAAWILGKDEESELYTKGGHIHQGLNSNLYRQLFGGTWDHPHFNSTTTPEVDAGLQESTGSGSLLGKIGTALLIADMADKGIGIGLSMLQNGVSGANDDPYRDAIYRDYSRGFLSGLFNQPDINDALNRIDSSVLKFDTGDSAYLMSQYNSYNPLLGSNSNPLFSGEKRRQNIINDAVDIANNQSILNFNTAVTNSNRLNLWNQLSQPYMAACGGKMKNRLASGGYINSHYDYITDPLVKVDAGGTHQENPNEGVLTSIAPDGQPNLVEEGETIINNGQEDAYVFSDRIVADDEILKSHLLPNKFAGKTYADISKELDKIIAEHKNDEISKRTFDEMISRLQQAQEDQKFQEKQEEVEKFLDGLTDEQKEQLEQTMVEEAQAEQQAAEEQVAAEQQAQEQAVQEQQMQPEQAPEQVAMEQPLEQIVPSRYDQMMSRALFADAADLGMFQLGGFEKTAADTYFYTTHPKIAFDKAKREYEKQDLQFKKTQYGLIVSSPIPSITNVYENIKDKIEDRKARKWAERYFDYQINRELGIKQPKHASDYVYDFVNWLTGHPDLSNNKKSKGGHLHQEAEPLIGQASGWTERETRNNREQLRYIGSEPDWLSEPSDGLFGRGGHLHQEYPFIKFDPNYNTNYLGVPYIKPVFASDIAEATDIYYNPTNKKPTIGTTIIRTDTPNQSKEVVIEAQPEQVKSYSNPHRPNYSIFGQYIPGLTPYEVDGNVLGYTDPLGKFVPIGSESNFGSTISSGSNNLNNSNTTITNSSAKHDEDKDGSVKSSTDYSTWLRYAPAIGSGIQYLSDLFGVTNRNDFSNADMYQKSINNIPSVGFTPLGNYMTYSPIDETYQQNVARSQYNAARRAIQNNASGNASAALAAMDSLNGNMNNTFGDLALQAREYNDKQLEVVEQFNANIARINSMMSLSAQEKNQAIAAEKARLTYNLAQMRHGIEDANDMAKSANFNNLMTNLGNIGRENYIINQVNNNLAYYYRDNGDGTYSYKYGLTNAEREAAERYAKENGLTIK